MSCFLRLLLQVPLGVRFAQDGFVGPLDVLSTEEVSCVAAGLAEYEQTLLHEASGLRGDARFNVHVLMPWAYRLVTHPKVIEAVAAALGTRDLLVWSCDINDKPPQSDAHFTYHQDSTYMGLSPGDCVLTAWIALSPASEEMGCVRFVPGSHLLGQLPHLEGQGGGDNVLSKGQAVVEREGFQWEEDAVAVPLQAGQMTLHAARTVHGSAANRTADRRVGLAVRFISASTRHVHPPTSAADKPLVTLASGQPGGALAEFELEATPTAFLGADERAMHALVMQREKARYFGAETEDAAGSGAGQYK